MNGQIEDQNIYLPNIATPPMVPVSPLVPTPQTVQDDESTANFIRDTAAALLLSHKLLRTKSIAPMAKRLIGTAIRYTDRDEDTHNEELDHIKTSSDKYISEDKAKKCIEDPECFATFLIHSAHTLLGPEYPAWQPGTIWITLKKEGIIIPAVNKDKLMASICIIQNNPQFFWDASVFEKTCLAFNSQEMFVNKWEHQFLGFLVWGISEVDGFHPDTVEFDYDVINYIAATAHHQGLLLLPDKLSFAQDRLDELNKNSHLVEKLKEVYENNKKIDCKDYFKDDLEVLDNISFLKIVDYYYTNRLKEFESQMKIYMN